MHTTLMIADIAVVVHQKRIKNLHLKVLPPDGAVQVSAAVSFFFRGDSSFADK